MTSIFPAAIIPVIIMGIVLELGKIAAVLFVHRSWKTAPFLIRSYLIISIFVLMGINSIGIFGFLSRAHIEQSVINSTQITLTTIVQAKLDNERTIVKDIDSQISQIDNALSTLTTQGKAITSIVQANAQRKLRDKLEEQKTQHLKTIEDLITEKVKEDNNNARVSAAFGPLLYIANAFYGAATQAQLENTVRWIITILIFVFDPLALILLVSSQHAFMNWQVRKKRLTFPEDKNIMNVDNEVMDFWKGDPFDKVRRG